MIRLRWALLGSLAGFGLAAAAVWDVGRALDRGFSELFGG